MMKLIVNPHRIKIVRDLVNEREIDITKCYFEFAEEITDEYVKEAYFTFKDKTYKQIIFNGECDIPSEVLAEKGQVELGVVAYLVENKEEIKRYNPSPAYFYTLAGSLKYDTENSESITPSEMEQFEQNLQKGINEILRAGKSIPQGGLKNQVLTKASDEDYDTVWKNISGSGSGTSDYNDLENKPSINHVELEGNKTLEELGINIPDISGINHDIENLTELTKELQDVTTKGIYVGYINSVTPNRNNMEEIIKNAINANASMIILRPTIDLPQNFVAISSGPNLQNYKDGGKGYMFFTDINEHSDSSEMPSVMSYTTKVTFTVTKDDDITVNINDVITDFVSGINSTSQHAYVLHTKNETEYIPTKPYHPSTKQYVDDAIEALKEELLNR